MRRGRSNPPSAGPRAALIAALAGCTSGHPSGQATLVEGGGAAMASRHIAISAARHGFEPSEVTVRRGETVTLTFTRTSARSCAKEVVLFLSDNRTARRALPLNQPVDITVTFTRAGEIGFACGMSMHGGAIRVTDP